VEGEVKLINLKFTQNGRGGLLGWRRGFELFGKLWCLEHSTVVVGAEKYLTRYLVYAFGGTLRLHKFWRGDSDEASHTHPWNFWTFPLTSYVERIYHKGVHTATNVVPAWHWHRRTCFHEHRVIGPLAQNGKPLDRPFWTIVITGPKINEWGFWVKDNTRQILTEPGKFVPWREFNSDGE
jgi:hypothetical protein